MNKYDASQMQNYESTHAGFSEHYKGNPPWEIGKPQAPFVTSADLVSGPLLDAGCGTGNTSIYFAARGLKVTGVDFVDSAIRQARSKADERNLSIEFLVKDALTFAQWDRQFASVIDSGLFHVYAGKKEQRDYVCGLTHVTQPNGRLFLLTFTDEAPEGGVSRQELLDRFAAGWAFESIESVRGEINPAFAAENPGAFAPGGPKMWFAIIRRARE